jgi:hypothetical protein
LPGANASSPAYNLIDPEFQEWSDAHSTSVVATVHYLGPEIATPVGSCAKRATILAAIKASADCLKHLVIVDGVTIEHELYDLGIAMDRYLLAHLETRFIRQTIFDEGARTVLFSDATPRPERSKLAGKA